MEREGKENGRRKEKVRGREIEKKEQNCKEEGKRKRKR